MIQSVAIFSKRRSLTANGEYVPHLGTCYSVVYSGDQRGPVPGRFELLARGRTGTRTTRFGRATIETELEDGKSIGEGDVTAAAAWRRAANRRLPRDSGNGRRATGDTGDVRPKHTGYKITAESIVRGLHTIMKLFNVLYGRNAM